jgi:hypothetical protein
MPSHAALCSFVFSMILTSALVPSAGNVALASAGAPAAELAVQTALNGLHAAGFAGGAQIALPTPAATPSATPAAATSAPTPSLSPELLNKILELLARRGYDKPLYAGYADFLKLAAPGQTWIYRGFSAVNHAHPNVLHAVAINQGPDQDMLISHVEIPVSIHLFRIGRDGKVISSMYMNLKTQEAVAPDPAEAQAEVNSEYAYWASAIDQLLAQ